MPSTKQELHAQWFAKYVTSGLISEQVFAELLEWDINLADLWHQCAHLKENLANSHANLLTDLKLIYLLALSGNTVILEQYLAKNTELIKVKDSKQRTVAHYVAMNGKREAVYEFLKNHPERALEKDQNGNGIVEYFNLASGIEITGPLEPYIQSAMVAAIPLLADRLTVSNEYEQHAFSTLMDLVEQRYHDAQIALEDNATEYFERFTRLSSLDKESDEHISKLKRWLTANPRLSCISQAKAVWDDHWWDKTEKFRGDATKLAAMGQHHELYVELRNAENILGLSYYHPEACPIAQRIASKLDEGYFVLGRYYAQDLARGDDLKACIAFANNVMNKKNRYFQKSVEKLKIISTRKESSETVQIVALLALGYATSNNQYLKNALSINEDLTAEYLVEKIKNPSFGLEQAIESLAYILLNFSEKMTKVFEQSCITAFGNKILKIIRSCKSLSETLDVLGISLDKIKEKPDAYWQAALPIIDDVEKQSPIHRAALVICLFNNANLDSHKKQILMKLCKTIPEALRIEVQRLSPPGMVPSTLINSSRLFQSAARNSQIELGASIQSTATSQNHNLSESALSAALPTPPTFISSSTLFQPAVQDSQLRLGVSTQSASTSQEQNLSVSTLIALGPTPPQTLEASLVLPNVPSATPQLTPVMK